MKEGLVSDPRVYLSVFSPSTYENRVESKIDGCSDSRYKTREGIDISPGCVGLAYVMSPVRKFVEVSIATSGLNSVASPNWGSDSDVTYPHQWYVDLAGSFDFRLAPSYTEVGLSTTDVWTMCNRKFWLGPSVYVPVLELLLSSYMRRYLGFMF